MKVGDRWESDWRQVSGPDVAQFADLTGDHDPLHSADAVESPFGKPVAHGLLGLSVMAGLSSVEPNAATLALASIEDWQFDSPIYFDDRVRVITEVVSIEDYGRRAGRVTWFRQLVNEKGKVVQHGKIITIVARRTRIRPMSARHQPSQQSQVQS